jgi:hypothetical protein
MHLLQTEWLLAQPVISKSPIFTAAMMLIIAERIHATHPESSDTADNLALVYTSISILRAQQERLVRHATALLLTTMFNIHPQVAVVRILHVRVTVRCLRVNFIGGVHRTVLERLISSDDDSLPDLHDLGPATHSDTGTHTTAMREPAERVTIPIFPAFTAFNRFLDRQPARPA